MKCQDLFSGKNKKNISKRRLLKTLPRVLSVNKTGSERRETSNTTSKFFGHFHQKKRQYLQLVCITAHQALSERGSVNKKRIYCICPKMQQLPSL